MSQLEDSETTYRKKLDRIKYCEIALDISQGHLKALPAILITNTVVLIVATVEVSGSSLGTPYLRTVAFWTLVLFAASAVVFGLLSWYITPRLTKNKRHSESLQAEVKALERLTVEGFGKYLGGMPSVRLVHLGPGILTENGRLNRSSCHLSWRKDLGISHDIQSNMEFKSRETVAKMDQLTNTSTVFADLFDTYSREWQKLAKQWDRRLANERIGISQFMRASIIGSYLFFSKEIQNEADIRGSVNRINSDSQVEQFLRDFFQGDPIKRESISSLCTNSFLIEAAQKTHKEHMAAVAEWDLLNSMLRELHSKWTRSLQ